MDTNETQITTTLIEGCWYVDFQNDMSTTENFQSAGESHTILKITPTQFSVWKRDMDPMLEEVSLDSNSQDIIEATMVSLYPFGSDSSEVVLSNDSLEVTFKSEGVTTDIFHFTPYIGKYPPEEWVTVEPDTIRLFMNSQCVDTLRSSSETLIGVYLTADEPYQLKLLETDVDMTLSLYDSEENLLKSEQKIANGDWAEIEFTPIQTGEYFLRVNAVESLSSDKSFKVVLMDSEISLSSYGISEYRGTYYLDTYTKHHNELGTMRHDDYSSASDSPFIVEIKGGYAKIWCKNSAFSFYQADKGVIDSTLVLHGNNERELGYLIYGGDADITKTSSGINLSYIYSLGSNIIQLRPTSTDTPAELW